MIKMILTPCNAYKVCTFTAEEAYTQLPQVDLYVPEFRQNGNALTHIKTETAWGKYLIGCISTWNTKHPIAFQISNAVHGVVGELMETYKEMALNLSKEEQLSEVGDVLYYRTILCYLYGMDLNFNQSDDIDLYGCLALLSDVGKKAAFHDKIANEKTLHRLDTGMGLLDALIVDLINLLDLPLDEIMQYNMHKLSNRHDSGKFNPNYT